jgi:hypothetical protein
MLDEQTLYSRRKAQSLLLLLLLGLVPNLRLEGVLKGRLEGWFEGHNINKK